MARFTRPGTYTAKAPRKPDTKTYEGAPAYSAPTDRKALFDLAVTNFVGQDTFYESAGARDTRYAELVGKVAIADPEWMVKFIRFLRGTANMRTASLVAAVEASMAREKAGLPPQSEPGQLGYAAQFVMMACQRADEPGELLGYLWLTYGIKPAKTPNGIKRGLARVAEILYNEYSALKYDTDKATVRFGDVIALTHPSPVTTKQSELFRYLAATRQHVPGLEIPEALHMFRTRADLYALPEDKRRDVVLAEPDRLNEAGMTWEALAGWGQGPMDAAMWEAIIPQMGYMALLRNLRNFDQAGISRSAVTKVKAKLRDPEEVAKSRQLPYRFLNAYKAVESDRWREPLGEALDASLKSIPELPGRTLVLVDVSGSMGSLMGRRYPNARPNPKALTMAEAGALFGVALAAKNGNADLVGFASDTFVHEVPKGASVLRQVQAFTRKIGSIGYGTEMTAAIRKHYRDHDRVVIISDMQAFASPWTGPVMDQVPADVPIYAFDLLGYDASPIDTERGNRYQFAGLTDLTFKVLALLEQGVEQVDLLD